MELQQIIHSAEIAKKCARAYNGSFCHLWGILNLQGPKKQKSTENFERYDLFNFT